MKIAKWLEEALKGITTIKDIAEIELPITQLKGRILKEAALGFQEGKRPAGASSTASTPSRRSAAHSSIGRYPHSRLKAPNVNFLNRDRKVRIRIFAVSAGATRNGDVENQYK